ncbi:hypothetical protein PAXINDRAFT_181808 [Paxillus involutus ATCC 200175]|uniref:T6SS Phospholipase effector Tle1-like catalytic domain-containing protein n=1 Tax=Paxillus involutus ATCC 200175 TaxID=664439 RepID=A0A0C9TWP8_PAXIN|nr:hypothetical protein PAXINDRAFT_181808 [Paxillus involutus ATCC 200175]
MAPKTLLIFCDGTGMDGTLSDPNSTLAQDNPSVLAYHTVAQPRDGPVEGGGSSQQYATNVLRLSRSVKNITSLPATVDVALHAISLQENRQKFLPTLWTPPQAGLGTNQVLKQYWFPGAHSDVGGSYEPHELADISLYWMAGEVQNIIELDLEFLRSYEQVNPDPWGTSQPHNAYIETPIIQRPIVGHETRLESKQIEKTSLFHESNKYSPQSLKAPDYMVTMTLIEKQFGSGFQPTFVAMNDFEKYCKDHWAKRKRSTRLAVKWVSSLQTHSKTGGYCTIETKIRDMSFAGGECEAEVVDCGEGDKTSDCDAKDPNGGEGPFDHIEGGPRDGGSVSWISFPVGYNNFVSFNNTSLVRVQASKKWLALTFSARVAWMPTVLSPTPGKMADWARARRWKCRSNVSSTSELEVGVHKWLFDGCEEGGVSGPLLPPLLGIALEEAKVSWPDIAAWMNGMAIVNSVKSDVPI